LLSPPSRNKNLPLRTIACFVTGLPSCREATLNAINTTQPDFDTDKDAHKQMARLERALELTMEMMEDAADRALRRKPEPEEPAAKQTKRPDAGQFFLHLTASLRQTVTLKARIAAGVKAVTQATAAPSPAAPETPDVATPEVATPAATSEAPAPAKPADKVYSGNQQEYMNSTSLSERLSPYAHKFANRTFPAINKGS
jgi:hypothetical protein